jgi:ATP-dependent Lhr-like helicase
MRFLFAWQHADTDFRLEGPLGLSAIVDMLQGFEIPAVAWETAVLPSRMVRYDPAWLDQLCLSGELAWARLYLPAESDGRHAGANRASPISLVFRHQMERWLALASGGNREQGTGNSKAGISKAEPSGGNSRAELFPVPCSLFPSSLGSGAHTVLHFLKAQGACFFQELVAGTGLLRTEVENALRELIASGRVTADGFAALRALVIAPDKALGTGSAKHKDGRPGNLPLIPPTAGRWSVLRRNGVSTSGNTTAGPAADIDVVELCAWQLLRRYGVVFHRLVERESGLPAWRELLYRFRKLEARGEIRGGRFVAGFSGEQYALPEAIQQLRAIRRRAPSGQLSAISGADPLNLAGITTPGEKIPALANNRILYRDGIPLAAREAGNVIELHSSAAELRSEIEARLR